MGKSEGVWISIFRGIDLQPLEINAPSISHIASLLSFITLCATETIEHDIPRLGIMEDVSHDCFVRNLCMVRMGIIDWIIFPLAHIGREWLAAVIVCLWVVGLPVAPDEILDEWVGAGGIVRRVRKGKNVFVCTDGETFYFPEFRVFQFFTKLSEEVGTARLIILKGHSKAFDLLLCPGLLFLLIGFLKQIGLTGGVAE